MLLAESAFEQPTFLLFFLYCHIILFLFNFLLTLRELLYLLLDQVLPWILQHLLLTIHTLPKKRNLQCATLCLLPLIQKFFLIANLFFLFVNNPLKAFAFIEKLPNVLDVFLSDYPTSWFKISSSSSYICPHLQITPYLLFDILLISVINISYFLSQCILDLRLFQHFFIKIFEHSCFELAYLICYFFNLFPLKVNNFLFFCLFL